MLKKGSYPNKASVLPDKSAVVIIGAGFGDEGKGLLTDFHAAPFGSDCIVARFNGGAQAGHTVVLPDGRRHVHSHFGSGALGGGKTFLSRYFVSNPLLFCRERRELERLGAAAPIVLADERGLVTTPYDMLANQWAEEARGSNRHGSCGVGFGETIERSLNEQFTLRIADLADIVRLKTMLNQIRQNWTAARLNQLKVPTLTGKQKDLLFSDQLRDDFIAAANEFRAYIQTAHPSILRTSAARVVLEGAQGLLLDERYGWFPHVTRSATGLKNAVELAVEAGLNRLKCIYTTRAYATRHGAGLLPHELAGKPYPKITDLTNVTNQHQGNLRFGWLDLDLLSSMIKADFRAYGAAPNIAMTKKLAITCLDQVDEKVFFVRSGALAQTTAEEFVRAAARAAQVSEIYLSYGPTRETITEMILEKAASSRIAALKS